MQTGPRPVASDPDARVHHQLLRFLLVGFVGFLADIGVMSLLVYGLDLATSNTSLIVSRIHAWIVAITVTYFLNARFTFGASIRHSRFVNYLIIQVIGAGINIGSFSLLILVGPLAGRPLLAMIAGNVLALINNFLLVRTFVYRFHPDVDDPE
jgi:putative flippase GtrA